MATSLEESEKLDLIKKIHANTFHLVKISLKSVQYILRYIALLIVKNEEEINASKIHSPSGKFAERAKKVYVCRVKVWLAVWRSCSVVRRMNEVTMLSPVSTTVGGRLRAGIPSSICNQTN